jgi:hypothetical protein
MKPASAHVLAPAKATLNYTLAPWLVFANGVNLPVVLQTIRNLTIHKRPKLSI